MGFLDKVTGAVLVGVFVLALLMFGYSAQVENDLDNTIFDDSHFAGINDTFFSNLSDVRGETVTQKETFEGQDPQAGEDEGFGLLTVPKNIARFTSLMFTSLGLVTNLLENVFGVPAIVFNVLGGLMIIIIIVLGWRVIKAGGT